MGSGLQRGKPRCRAIALLPTLLTESATKPTLLTTTELRLRFLQSTLKDHNEPSLYNLVIWGSESRLLWRGEQRLYLPYHQVTSRS